MRPAAMWPSAVGLATEWQCRPKRRQSITLTAEERLLSAVGTPCGFRAERCVRSGDTAVMSGITTVRFEGVSPLEMVVAGEGDDLIELRARVTGRDGAGGGARGCDEG